MWLKSHDFDDFLDFSVSFASYFAICIGRPIKNRCDNLLIFLFSTVMGNLCPVPLGIRNAKKSQETQQSLQNHVLSSFLVLSVFGKTFKSPAWSRRALPLGGLGAFGVQSHLNCSVSPQW